MHAGSLGEGTESPATGVTDSFEWPCGYWELNWGPLNEQAVLLAPQPVLMFSLPRYVYSLCEADKNFDTYKTLSDTFSNHGYYLKFTENNT